MGSFSLSHHQVLTEPQPKHHSCLQAKSKFFKRLKKTFHSVPRLFSGSLAFVFSMEACMLGAGVRVNRGTALSNIKRPLFGAKQEKHKMFHTWGKPEWTQKSNYRESQPDRRTRVYRGTSAVCGWEQYHQQRANINPWWWFSQSVNTTFSLLHNNRVY